MQIKATMKYHHSQVRMASIKKFTNSKWRGCGEKGIFLHHWGCKLVQPLWRAVWRLLKGEEPRWGGIGRGDHFLSYKFTERLFEHWANFTKQLLTTSRRQQAPRKAAHHLWKEVGQNIKDKKRDKRARDGDPSREGSLNRGNFQTLGNPLTGRSGGSFRISEGNLTGRKCK